MERFAGRFALLRPLGEGGMGEVHLALDHATGAVCALKRLRARGAGAPGESLRREFELLSRVRHPAIVEVHELGLAPDGTVFYTMAYVPGQPADRALRHGDWSALAGAGAQVAHALEALHAQGIVHGDLKPANLLVIAGEAAGAFAASVRLLDFGLAALLSGRGEGHRGTPGFAAPEIARGERCSIAGDLYGLGATLYALACGRTAAAATGARSAPSRALEGAPSALPLEEAGVPAPLRQLILRLMAPAPGERPREAREVRAELERFEPGARRDLAGRLGAGPVVGRERESARLERWLARGEGGAHVLVLRGEPGAGASSLLRELGVRASLGGHPVVRIACAAAPGSLARALVRHLAAGVSAASEPEACRRVRAWAERDDFGETLGPEALAPPVHAWGAMLARAGKPAIVLLDDASALAAADRATLRHLVFHAGGGALRWALAERAGDPLEARLLPDAPQVERLELGALDRVAIARLAASRLHAIPPEALVEFLAARSGGHAGLAVELLRAAADSGALTENEAGIAIDAAQLARLAPGTGYESARRQRVEALPRETRAAADALAILARPASEAELRALAPATNATTLEALRSIAIAARDAAGAWSLQPPALATHLVEALASDDRSRLHAAALALPALPARERFAHLRGTGDAGAALEAAEAAWREGDGAEIAAAAAELAGEAAPALAAGWHERAGRALLEAGRHRAALAHLERALEASPAGEARASRALLLSNACLRAGRPAEVERIVTGALADDPPARLRSLLLANDAAHRLATGQPDAAVARAKEALEHGLAADDDEAAGIAGLTLASAQLALGRAAEADATAESARVRLEQAGRADAAVRARSVRAAAALASGDAGRAETLFREGIALAQSQRLRHPGEEALMNLAVLLLETGRWAEAAEVHAACLRSGLEDGRTRTIAIATVNLAVEDALAGRARAALRRARAGIRLARAYAPGGEAGAWRALALASRVAGRPRAAREAARRALALAVASGSEAEREWCRIEYARQCALAGRWREAGAVAAAPAEAAREPSIAAGILATFAARAAIRRRDGDSAAEHLASASTALAGREAPYAAAHLKQAQAERAWLRGEGGEARRLADEALAAFAALPAPSERAAAAVDFARMAIAADPAAASPALEWLVDAAGAFERLGDHPGRERALALALDRMERVRPAASTRPGRDLLHSVSGLLDSLADLPALTRRAMRMAVEHLDAERGVLLLADDDTGALAVVAEHGAVDAEARDRALGYSRAIVERVTRSGGSLLVGDAPGDPLMRSESVMDLGLRSIVCVPMHAGGRVLGAVYLDDSRRPQAFGEDDRRLLEGFAHLMAIAIEKSRGHAEVQRDNERLVGENLSLRRGARARFQPRNFVGDSSAMQEVLAVAARAARTSSTVLISGENGTGKELIARILHHTGARRSKPFVVVNCGAIPETLLESELFGILPNVATGVRARDGCFVQADGGTLFLDEVGDMPLQQQVALLTAIASKEITPVGGGRPIHVDVRIVAASNRDLRRRVQEGAFREDLFYRLNVIPIEMPPLRERKADIPALASHFASLFARQQGRALPVLSPELLAALMRSDWPGNVRELQNYIERVMAMTPGETLMPDRLPRDLESQEPRLRLARGKRFHEVTSELEQRLIQDALVRSEGNQSRAARELGMTEQTLRYRLRKLEPMQARSNLRTRRKWR